MIAPTESIVDPKTRGELCFEHHDLLSESWIYNLKSNSCILYDALEKMAKLGRTKLLYV